MTKNRRMIIVLMSVLMVLLVLSSCVRRSNVNRAPSEVVNIYPAQSELIEENSVNTQWSTSVDPEGGAVRYIVQYARSVEELADAEMFTTDEPQNTSPQLEAGIWYWQVTAIDNAANQTKSSVWNFTVNDEFLPQPVDIEEVPEDPALIVATVDVTSFSLEWPEYEDPNDETNIIVYDIYVYEVEESESQARMVKDRGYWMARSNPATIASTTETFHTFEHLDSETLYDWTIIAKKNATMTAMVGSSNVRTGNNPPQPAKITNPAYGSTQQGTVVNLEWEASIDPDGDEVKYFIYLDTVPHSYKIISDPKGIDETSLMATGLETGRTYYWHIMTKDSYDAATRTQSYYFNTESFGLGVAHTPEPVDGQTGVSRLPLLSWQLDEGGRTITYNVYLSDKPNNLKKVADSITVKNWQQTEALAAGKKYYWQIEAKDSASGQTTLSQVWTFRTLSLPTPEQISAQTNITGTQIELTYNMTMADPTGNHGSFIVKRGEESITPQSIVLPEGATNTYILSFNEVFKHGDVLTIDYTTGTVKATNGRKLLSYTNKPVTNNVPAAPENPKFVSAKTSSNGQTIYVTFDKEMADPTGKHTQFRLHNNESGIVARGTRELVTFTAAKLNANNHKIIELTLEKAAEYGQTLLLDYTAGSVKASDNTVLEDFSDKPVTNFVSGPPVFVSANTSQDGKTVYVTFDKEMADPAGKHNQFTLDVTVAGQEQRTVNPFTSAKLYGENNKIIELTLENVVGYGEVLKLSYAPGDVKAADNTMLKAFTDKDVANHVAAQPEFVSAQTSADGKTVYVTFDKEMADPTDKHAQFSLNVTGAVASQRAVYDFTSAKLNTDNHKIIELILEKTVGYGEILKLNYTAGSIMAKDNTMLKSFTDKAVTNNLPAIPTFVSAKTSTDGQTVYVTFDKEMADPTDKHSQFSLTVKEDEAAQRGTYTFTGAKLNTNNKIIELTLETAVVYGQTLELNYTKGDIKAADDTMLSSFASQTVVNGIGAPPEFVSAQTTSDGKTIKVTFDKTMEDPEGKHGQFSLSVTEQNTESRTERLTYTITGAKLNTNKKIMELSVSATISESKTVKLSYTPGDVKSTDGGVLKAFVDKPVTNNGPSFLPPELQSASLTAHGTSVILRFDQEMNAPANDQAQQFEITVNSSECSITAIALSDDAYSIILRVATPVGRGNNDVKVSYTAGAIAATTGDPLADFQNENVATSTVVVYWVSKDTPWNYETIQAAFDDAAIGDGDTVMVMPGTYTENVDFNRKAVVLKSTYETDAQASVTTVIDGNYAGTTVMIDGSFDSSARDSVSATATVAGFTITGGGDDLSNVAARASWYVNSGIAVAKMPAIIRDNIIRDNGQSGDLVGRGITTCESNVEIYNNQIRNNYNKIGGAGIFVFDNSKANIYNNVIENNLVTGKSGAGIFIFGVGSGSSQRTSTENSTARIYENTFRDNEALNGVSVYVKEGATVYNKAGEAWRAFNIPTATVTFVENSDTANNQYFPNATVTTAATEGGLVYFDGNGQSVKGTLAVAPATSAGLKDQKIELTVTFTVDSDTSEGTFTIVLPDEASVTSGASVTINSEKRDLADDELSDKGTEVKLTGLNAEDQLVIVLEYSITPQERMSNGDYLYTAGFDADGSGTRYTPSEESAATLTIPTDYATPDIVVVSPKDGVDLDSNDVTFTWEATAGAVANPVMARNGSGIEKYILYYAKKGDNYGAGVEVTGAKTKDITLDYAEEYKWKVDAVGSDGKIETTTPDATFMTKFRLCDLETLNASYSINNDDGHFDLFDVGIDKTGMTIPSGHRLEGANTFTMEVDGRTWLFVHNEFNANQLNVMVEYDPTPTLDQVRDARISVGKPIELSTDGPVSYHETIQSAIGELESGDEATIVINTPRWGESSWISFIGKEITVKPSTDFETVIVDGCDDHYVFYAGSAASVTFDHLIIQNGKFSGSGGAVRAYGSSDAKAIVTLKDCTIRNNQAEFGGGVYAKYSDIFVEDTVFTDNSCYYNGGALCMDTGATVTITSATITNNSANKGGGIWMSNTSAIQTAGNAWEDNAFYFGSMNADFSVDSTGEVHGGGNGLPVAADPIQVYGNTVSGTDHDGAQLYLEP